ncbi:hypothetical protein ACJ72_02875 [Emergomyces africanus]|uniref:Uncharacterized protein n=1 Tax=Emergomyces africanus TaxID=1955775 RepID=A0A1B7P175_9EURO|nr:hypothetical protein ACJ72_02875 [Emergomyces africanus]
MTPSSFRGRNNSTYEQRSGLLGNRTIEAIREIQTTSLVGDPILAISITSRNNLSISAYLTRKIALLREAGITDAIQLVQHLYDSLEKGNCNSFAQSMIWSIEPQASLFLR